MLAGPKPICVCICGGWGWGQVPVEGAEVTHGTFTFHYESSSHTTTCTNVVHVPAAAECLSPFSQHANTHQRCFLTHMCKCMMPTCTLTCDERLLSHTQTHTHNTHTHPHTHQEALNIKITQAWVLTSTHLNATETRLNLIIIESC